MAIVEDYAALVLAWTRTRGFMNVLLHNFGIKMTNLHIF